MGSGERKGKIGMKALRASLLAVALIMPTASTANASQTGLCQDDPIVTRFSGDFGTAGTEQGIRGFFDSQSILVCTGTGNPAIDDRGTSMWVVVSGPAVGGINLIQYGIARCNGLGPSYCDGTLRQLFAWGRDNAAPGCSGLADVLPTGSSTGTPPVSGVDHRYTITHEGAWFAYYDSMLEGSVLNSSICWTPDDLKVFGESKDSGDGIGGSAANHFDVSGIQVQSSFGGAWQNANFGASCAYGDANRRCTVPSSNTLSIWTDF